MSTAARPLRPKARELPEPARTPLDVQGAVLGRLWTRGARAQAETLLDGEPVLVAVKSRTRVDTGGWTGGRRVWACVQAGRLALFAPGPRPLAQRIAYGDLGESVYNHVTGELVLAPAPEAPCRLLRVAPLDGYQLLAQILGTESREDPHA